MRVNGKPTETIPQPVAQRRGSLRQLANRKHDFRFMHHRLRSAGATPVSGGIVGAVGVVGNVIGTNRAASFAASRTAVSARSMKISASMAYSIHIAVTRQTLTTQF